MNWTDFFLDFCYQYAYGQLLNDQAIKLFL